MKDEKAKLDIKSCKFACDKVKSINLNENELSNSLIVFNLMKQVFNYDEKMYNKSKKLFFTAISLASIVVIILVSVIIKIKKNDDDGENDDPLNQPLDVNNIL